MSTRGFKNMNADQIIKCILQVMLKLEKSVSGIVEDQIVDGVVDKAPSQNIVFDGFYSLKAVDDNLSDRIDNTENSITNLEEGKVSKNVAITGATKTKITYDSKGLVTAGADATTVDIADTTNKRYVTDANLTKVNAIDQSVSASEKATWNSKQNAMSIASDAEMQTGTENTKYTTALRIATWFVWIKTQAHTWLMKQTFALAPRFSSATASQFLKVDSNKDLVSVSEASDAEMQTGTENTKPVTALRIATWFNWRLGQAFTFGSLAGSGIRLMQVNSSGDVSAPYAIQDGFTTDSDVITSLTGAAYNSGNNFTATLSPANSKVFSQGQWYKNAGVIYFAVADNQASRITLS